MMSVQEAEEQTAAALSAQIAISQLQAEIQVALKKAAPAAAVVGCGGSKGGRGGTAGVLMPASGSAPGAQAEEDLLVDSTAVTTTVSTTAACATVASCLPHELISLILSLAATASSTSAAFDVYSARLLLLIPQKSLKDTSDSYSASPLATLFSCSLVCRAWCLAAMPLIYNHREFNKNGGGGGGFKFTLKDDNHTLAFIRGLSYYTAFSANKEEQETTVLLDRLSSITSLAFPSSKLAGCLIGTTSKLLFPALKHIAIQHRCTEDHRTPPPPPLPQPPLTPGSRMSPEEEESWIAAMRKNCSPLDPQVVYSLVELFPRLESLTVEDVDVAAWASLMTMVMIRGTQLKKLSIEAVPTMEAFESSFDTSAILALLPLQHLRLDGISFGGGIDAIHKFATHSTTNLRSILFDYCVDVDMEAVAVLWNACPNLAFIGLAGVSTGMLPEELFDETEMGLNVNGGGGNSAALWATLKRHDHLRTLRLVDCDVTNSFLNAVGRNAPFLRMIRVVFEDETCLGVREVTHHLEDRGLESFASPLDSSTSPFSVSSPNSPSSTSSSSNRFSFSSSTSSYSPSSTMIPFHSLTVLAFCACPNLSPHIFRRIMLAQPHIQVFDMHKHPSTQLGEVNDAFLDIVFGDGFVKGGVEEEDDEVGEEELSLLNLNITTTTTITPSILFPSLRAVNLFGQASISPTGLCTVLRNLYAYTGGKLDSICLNFCRVDKSVVDTLIEVGKRTLKRISLCDVKVGKVKAEGKEELEGKAEENEETLSPDDVLRLVMDLDYVEVVYVVKDVYEAVVKLVAESYLDDLKMVDRCKRKLSTADSWFMLEGLDIYSLWERASKVQ